MRGICLCFIAVFGVVGAALTAPVALARITPADYRDVGVSVPENASVPLTAVVTGDDGRRHSLHELVTRSTVLVFADYTCRTLCGPILDFVDTALETSGLRADQYRLLVVGLDPKDGAKEANKMRRAHIESGSALDHETQFVIADQPAIQAMTAALGYRYHYSADDDVYIHPAAAYVLSADGHVTRVLTGLGLTGADMRLALVEASEGKIGTFRDEVRLLCSGFDPVHGAYTLKIWRVLQLASLATIFTVGGGIGLLLLTGRRHTV